MFLTQLTNYESQKGFNNLEVTSNTQIHTHNQYQLPFDTVGILKGGNQTKEEENIPTSNTRL